jgi:hypothetical protein
MSSVHYIKNIFSLEADISTEGGIVLPEHVASVNKWKYFVTSFMRA